MFNKQSNSSGNEWISISDMMAGIMMIFLLIAVSYMIMSAGNQEKLASQNKQLVALNTKVNEIARTYEVLQKNLYQDLKKEFVKDLQGWNAEIGSDGIVRFKQPDILFDAGKKEVKEHFKAILDNFFPRYVKLLSQDKYKGSIEEIRIEGHTSEEWRSNKDLNVRYLENAELSQARALEVLKYCFVNKRIAKQRQWLISVLRANGLSFAQPLETPELSRRVEFKVITTSDKEITEILKLGETIQAKEKKEKQ